MKRHKHAKLLETIVHYIQVDEETSYLYKVKARAGILGNECADAIAKCSANLTGHDIQIDTDNHPYSNIFWPAKVEDPPARPPNTSNTNQPIPSTEQLSILPDNSVVTAHMHGIAREIQTRPYIKSGFRLSVRLILHKISRTSFERQCRERRK